MKNIKKLFSFLLATVLVLSICGCQRGYEDYSVPSDAPELGENIWEESYLDFFIELEEDADAQTEEELFEPEFEMVESASETNVTEVFEEIKTFFKDNYDIDVSDKLAEINQVWYIKYTNVDPDYEIFNLNRGFFDEETGVINLEERVSKKEEKSAIMHLVLNTLIKADISDERVGLLSEGLIEAISEKIAKANGWKYIHIEDYEHAIAMAKQMLVVNPEMENKIFKDSNFNMVDHFKEVLGGIPLYNGDTWIDNNPDEVLSVYATCIEELSFNGELEDETYTMLYMQAELITIAYCREFNPTEDQIEEIRGNYYYPDFEDQIYTQGEIPEAVKA